MNDIPDIVKWLWFGSGFLGVVLLVRNPEKLVFEDNFWGTQIKTVMIILSIAFLALGPIMIVIALLLPKRKLCPHCFKAIETEAMACTFCGKIISQKDEIVDKNPRERFSKEVLYAIEQGVKQINIPAMFIMFGVLIIGGIITYIVNSPISLFVCIVLSFIAAWLWWSYKVPRWRRWALRQPGVDPEQLQSAGEAANLLWPKGHFFEKTEFKLPPSENLDR